MANTSTRPFIDRVEVEHLSAMDAEVPNPRPGQNWGVIIFVGPKAHQKCEHFAINFIGAFPTAEDANQYCLKLQNNGWNFFTTYVIPMNKLIPFPPPSDKDVEECVYPDNILNQLMDRHKKDMFEAEDRIDGRLSKLHAMEAEKQLRMRSQDAIQAEQKLIGGVPIADIDPDDEKSTHINKVHCLMGETRNEPPIGAKIVSAVSSTTK